MRYVGTYSENQDIATKEKLKECVEYTQLPITMPTTGIWKVTYANERFVSVLSSPSHAYGVCSTDGVHWTAAAPLPIPGGFGSIVYGDGKFVCTSARTNAVIYSSDGVVWKKATLPSGITCEFVAYGNGKFVAVPAGLVTTYVYSTDGINWVKGEFKFDTTIDFNGGIAYGNGKFVGVSSSNKSYYSNDGISWNIGGSLGFNNASSIAYGNGKFVVPYGTKVFYSVDGINWSQTTTSNPVSSNLIFYGGDKFFTYPSYSNNAIAYSTDGVTWYESELPFATQWRTMAYGDNKYIITTSSTAVSGKLAISTDGINWTTTANVLQYPDGTDITSDVKETLGVPTKVSELTNDARYITASQAPVQAINGKTGYVTVSTTFVAYRLGNSSATVTFAEMLEAWKRGDICILRYGAAGMLEYQLFSVVDNESITFVYVDGDIIREIVWTADGNFTDNNIEKSTVLNEASTDHQFPTSKTVWGAIPHPETKTDTQTQSVSVDSDGKLWTDAPPVTSVNGKTGDVTVEGLPPVTTSDNNKVLQVRSGQWGAHTIAGLDKLNLAIRLEEMPIEVNNFAISDVIKYNNQFVAMARSGRNIALSTDGINWTIKKNILPAYPDGTTAHWSRIKYFNSYYVVISLDGKYWCYTTNPTVENGWTTSALPSGMNDGNWTVLDECGQALVAGGWSSEHTWHLQGSVYTGWYQSSISTGYAYDSHVEMATMYLATSNGIYTSDDGYTWKNENDEGHLDWEFYGHPVSAFAKSPAGDLIAFISNGAARVVILEMDTNGNWQPTIETDFGFDATDGEVCAYIRATYFDGQWILFNWAQQVVFWSSDLSSTSWLYYNFNFEAAPAIPFIEVSNKKLVIGVSADDTGVAFTQFAYTNGLEGMYDNEGWNENKDILTIDDGTPYGMDVTDRIRKLIMGET